MSQEAEDVNVLLLKQLVPFTLNISHYMTDLAYTLYYSVMLHHGDNSKAVQELQQSKMELCDEIYKLRDGFRNMLNRPSGSLFARLSGRSDHEGEGEVQAQDSSSESALEDDEEVYKLIQTFRKLFDSELLRVIKFMNEMVERDLALGPGGPSAPADPERAKLLVQLKNCMLGFYNLINFVKRIPVKSHGTAAAPAAATRSAETEQAPSTDDRQYMESIVAVLRDELLATWKVELDLLNCKIFSLISQNTEILALFHEHQRKTGVPSAPVDRDGITEDSQTFIQLISWLKDEQVFNDSKHKGQL